MPFADLPRGRMRYEDEGDGPPLVLITGLGGLAAFWAPHVERLARRFRVIRYDHFGTGGSDVHAPPYSVPAMAEDLLALMDALEIPAAHLVGHSTGGAIAQLVGAEARERTLSLCLAGAWGRPDSYFSRCFDARLPVLHQLGAEPYFQITSLLLYPPDWISQDPERLAAIEAQAVAGLTRPEILSARIAAICAFDGREAARLISAPTLVLSARDDMTTALFLGEELAAGIPGARLQILDWGGHMFPLTSPEFPGILDTWLEEAALLRA